MEDSRTQTFFQQITQMLDTAGLPAAIVDEQFYVVWLSRVGAERLPSLALPDGVRLLLGECPVSAAKKQIAQNGCYICRGGGLLAGHPMVIYALPDGSDRYLLRPSEGEEGTGMHPEGVSRTLSTFGSQYRAPLTIIFSSLTLLSRAYADGAEESARSAVPQYLDAIHRSAFQLLRSCEYISDFTRLTCGLAPLMPKRVDLLYYLRELFVAAQEMVEASGIPFSATVPEGILTVACDTDKLSSAILNILSNACRFTRSGNRISVKVRSRRGLVVITVADRGAGIPEEILPRVFEPYFSYGPGGQPFAGNGLGLSIAHDAIAAIGGTIVLTSTFGKGTTVVFNLPVSDDPSATPAVFCEAADYISDRFSPLRVALSDSIPPVL